MDPSTWDEATPAYSRAGQSLPLPSWQCCSWCPLDMGDPPACQGTAGSCSATQKQDPPGPLLPSSLSFPVCPYIHGCPIPGVESSIYPGWTSLQHVILAKHYTDKKHKLLVRNGLQINTVNWIWIVFFYWLGQHLQDDKVACTRHL